MDDYNFWRDFFDTYQSFADWVKALWLTVPPTFILALLWLLARHRRPPQLGSSTAGRLIYSIYRDDQNQVHIVRHLPESSEAPNMLMGDPSREDDAIADNVEKRLTRIGTVASKPRRMSP